MTDNIKKYIDLLKEQIELTTHRKPFTPNDFIFISSQIEEKMREHISSTTLMRIWEYVKEPSQTRLSTLNILSRFLNYKDFEAFVESMKHYDEESKQIHNTHLRAENMVKGDCIEIKWNSNRRCVFQYEGNHTFTVKISENSKLQEGDKFSCSHFIQNQPLYIFDLEQNNTFYDSFVVGAKNGITELNIIRNEK